MPYAVQKLRYSNKKGAQAFLMEPMGKREYNTGDIYTHCLKYCHLYFHILLSLAAVGLLIHCSSSFQSFRRRTNTCFKRKSHYSAFPPSAKKKLWWKPDVIKRKKDFLNYFTHRWLSLKDSDHTFPSIMQSILLSKINCPGVRSPENIRASMLGGGGEG